jgi:hypothetical protein
LAGNLKSSTEEFTGEVFSLLAMMIPSKGKMGMMACT